MAGNTNKPKKQYIPAPKPTPAAVPPRAKLLAKPLPAPDDPAADAAKRVRRRRIIFLLCVAAFIICGGLLFDTKLHLMGDDADYIMDAFYFVHQHTYPALRSSLYGMTLGLPVAVFGIHVAWLKMLSFGSALVAFCLLYFFYKDKVPYWLLFCTLIFTALNSEIQYYSSSNLSEAFYMMIQAAYLYLIFRLLSAQNDNRQDMRREWILVGLFGLLISLSKNVAIIAPLVLPVYFLCYAKWKDAGKALGIFLLFKVPYEVMIRLLYRKSTGVTQLGQVLAKDLYHPERGNETAGGFVARFFKNINIYFAGDTMAVFGFNNPVLPKQNVAVWIGFVIVWAFGIIRSYKRNRWMFFTGIFLAMMCAVTFVALQPAVAQMRIIIIFTPLLFLFMLYALWEALQLIFTKNLQPAAIAVGLLAGIMIIINAQRTSDKVGDNISELMENLSDDPFYGYTPDWSNYLQMGRWVKQNIPDSVGVAARKPNSLTVYSYGRPFEGIYQVPDTASAETLMNQLKARHIHYMILASLRVNPELVTGQVISTLHVYAKRMLDKYPGKVNVVYTIGKQEPCYLVKVDY